MKIQFSILDTIGILKAFGETEVSQSLEQMVNDNPLKLSTRGFTETIRNYLSYTDSDTIYRDTISKFVYEDVFDRDWYHKGLDSIDLNLLPDGVTINDILLYCLSEGYTPHTKYKLFSDRFRGVLSDVVYGIDHPKSKLFDIEVYYNSYKSFNKLYDRNFDCKESEGDIMVSYQAKGKNTVLSENGKWVKDTRTSAKPIRVIKKMRTMFTYPDSFYEKLNNTLVARYSMKGEFVVFSGSDIVKYYHENMVNSNVNTGSLGTSCMRYDGCSEYIELYAENPDVVSMLTYLDGSQLVIGRALLWTIDGEVYMDRIYGSDSMIEKFKKYAQNNGISWKLEQSYSNTEDWCKYVEETKSVMDYSKRLYVTLKNINRAPYMDTFKYVDDTCGDYITINNYSGDHELSGTDGNYDVFDEDEDVVYCRISDDRMDINDDDCIEIDGNYYNARYCSYSRRNSQWYLSEESVYVDSIDDTVHQDDAVYISYAESSYFDQYILNDEAVWIESIGEDVHEDESYYNTILCETCFIADKLVEVVVVFDDARVLKAEIDRGSMTLDDIREALEGDIVSITIEGELIYELKEEEALAND